MILVDTSLLVYAQVESLPQHESASAWLDSRLNGVTGVGMPWASLLGFTRLVSNPRVFARAIPVQRAWEQVERWLALEPVWVPEPAGRHEEIMRDLIPKVGKAEICPTRTWRRWPSNTASCS